MTIGEKIKNRRLALRRTQSEVAGNYISRNMLSLIESGNATPSLETLRYLSDALNIPIEYLVSEREDISPFLKLELEAEIYNSFAHGFYEKTIELVNKIGQIDDGMKLIAAEAAYRFARIKLAGGSLESAKKYLSLALRHLSESKLDSPILRAKCLLAESIAQNIQSPKLNFDEQKYLFIIIPSIFHTLIKMKFSLFIFALKS